MDTFHYVLFLVVELTQATPQKEVILPIYRLPLIAVCMDPDADLTYNANT